MVNPLCSGYPNTVGSMLPFYSSPVAVGVMQPFQPFLLWRTQYTRGYVAIVALSSVETPTGCEAISQETTLETPTGPSYEAFLSSSQNCGGVISNFTPLHSGHLRTVCGYHFKIPILHGQHQRYNILLWATTSWEGKTFPWLLKWFCGDHSPTRCLFFVGGHMPWLL